MNLFELNLKNNFIDIYSYCSNRIIWTILFYLNNNNNSLYLFFLLFICFFCYFYKNKLLYVYIIIHYLINSSLININLTDILTIRINNTPLSNGILLIHPFFIYLTYFYLFIFIYFNLKSLIKYNFYLTIVLMSYVAIFLGSFWAQQELNWGGWWNWDFVELIAFIFFLFPLIFIHWKKENLFFNVYKNNLYFYFFLFFIIVRCDILSSVHSFNSFSFLEKYLYYIYLFFMFLVIFFLFLKKKMFFKYYFFRIKEKRLNWIYCLFSAIITIIVCYIMYNIILFYILNRQNINSFFFIKLFFYLLTSYSILTVFNWKFNLIFLFLFFFNFYFFLLFIFFYYLFFFKEKNIFLIHFIIILFMVLVESYTYVFGELNISYLNLFISFENDFLIFKKNNFFNECILYLNSFFVINASNFLTSGFLENLLINNIFIKFFNFIQYDLIDNSIFLCYKNMYLLFLISCFFIIIILIFKKISKNSYQVV